jgi:hypothetical protein
MRLGHPGLRLTLAAQGKRAVMDLDLDLVCGEAGQFSREGEGIGGLIQVHRRHPRADAPAGLLAVAAPAVRLRVVGLQVQGARVRIGAGWQLGSHARQAQHLAQLLRQRIGQLRMFLEILLRVFASLANAVLLVRIPGAAFVDEVFVAREVQPSPFGQKSQTRFFTRSYELAIACSSACNPAHNRQCSTSIVGK